MLMAGACYAAAMSKTPDQMIAGFTTGERDYICRELDMVFPTLPSVAEGFQLTAAPTPASRRCRRSRRD